MAISIVFGVGISYCVWSEDIVLCLEWGYRIVFLSGDIDCAWSGDIVLCLE